MNLILISALAGTMVSDADLLTTVLTLEDNHSVGMKAVAQVVWNRANHNPRKIRNVLLKKWQFSCINSHTVRGESLVSLVRKARSRSNWQEAREIAANAIAGKVENIVGDSTHYHVWCGRYRVTPSWTHPRLGGTNSKAVIVKYIGDHVFLSEVDK
jgi:spore germination cell wall hydrolase CwlJ-like protein